MSNTYIAINKGVSGFHNSDFTIGTSSSASSDIEVRVAAVDGAGHTIDRLVVILGLKAITRALENNLVSGVPPI